MAVKSITLYAMQVAKEEKYLGIEIGGTKLQLVTGTAEGTIEESIRYSINITNGAAGIQHQIKEGVGRLNLEAIAAVGVGFGGPVNWKTGTIERSHQVEGWENINIKQWLEGLTGKAVCIDNDANVAALAEAIHGHGKSYDRVFYMTIGSGIGGGLILNSTIYHGRTPGEVEVGHLRMNKMGQTLEDRCSGWAVNKKVKSVIEQHHESLLAQLAQNHTAPEATLLPQALDKGDTVALQLINEVADDLAFALSHIVHLFHPDILIIGGGLSLLEEHLRKPLEERLAKYVMQAFLPAPPVRIALLREDVVPVGALTLAKTTLFK